MSILFKTSFIWMYLLITKSSRLALPCDKWESANDTNVTFVTLVVHASLNCSNDYILKFVKNCIDNMTLSTVFKPDYSSAMKIPFISRENNSKSSNFVKRYEDLLTQMYSNESCQLKKVDAFNATYLLNILCMHGDGGYCVQENSKKHSVDLDLSCLYDKGSCSQTVYKNIFRLCNKVPENQFCNDDGQTSYPSPNSNYTSTRKQLSSPLPKSNDTTTKGHRTVSFSIETTKNKRSLPTLNDTSKDGHSSSLLSIKTMEPTTQRQSTPTPRATTTEDAKMVLIITSNSNKISEGDRIAITCTTTGGNPPPVLLWKWNGVNITNSDKPMIFEQKRGTQMGSNTSSSMVTIVKWVDDGAIISCLAINPATKTITIEQKYNLSVLYRPRVTLHGRTKLMEGDTLMLHCSVFANPPVQRRDWTKNKELIQSSQQKNLTIGSVTGDNSGSYTCTARNEIDKTSDTVVVLVSHREGLTSARTWGLAAAVISSCVLIPVIVSVLVWTYIKKARKREQDLRDNLDSYNSVALEDLLPMCHHEPSDTQKKKHTYADSVYCSSESTMPRRRSKKSRKSRESRGTKGRSSRYKKDRASNKKSHRRKANKVDSSYTSNDTPLEFDKKKTRSKRKSDKNHGRSQRKKVSSTPEKRSPSDKGTQSFFAHGSAKNEKDNHYQTLNKKTRDSSKRTKDKTRLKDNGLYTKLVDNRDEDEHVYADNVGNRPPSSYRHRPLPATPVLGSTRTKNNDTRRSKP